MNFLAHIYLSGEDQDVLLGNFMADKVKGRDLSQYEQGVQKGIRLHRLIDHFTDTHSVSGVGREILRPNMGKYAGVVLDVFYDHFLAAAWSRYNDQPLAEYTADVYERLSARKAEMPEQMQFLFHYMKTQDWLSGYATIDGIDRALNGLSKRVSRGSQMARSRDELIINYDELSKNFDEFFPLIQAECRAFLSS